MNNRKPPGRKSPDEGDDGKKKPKPQPQLSPDIQGKLGQLLRRHYDDMVSQGVPDRFARLIDRLDKPKSDEPR